MTEHDMALGLALASTLVQFTAALLALRLIPLTHHRLAWVLMSSAFIVQGARRALSVAITAQHVQAPWALQADGVLGLGISILLLGGVAYIAPLFRTLRESEERFRTVADFTHDMEYWRLPNGEFRYLSPSCERISGHSAQAFKKNPGLMLDIVHPDDQEMVREHLIRDDLETTGSNTMDYRILLPDGSVRWLAHACQPVFNAEGSYLGRRGSNRDVTPRKLAEARQEDVERILRHDLKSPLMGIIGIPRVLREEEGVPDHVKRLLDILERSGQDMLDLIESSLAIHRLERGEPIDAHESVNMVEVVRDTIESLTHKAMSLKVRLVCTVQGRECTPGNVVACQGVRMLLRSMMGNLIKNALEASGQGDVVSIDLRQGTMVEILIHNTGVVPEAVREKLFEKYTSAGKAYGTGLGAYSARLMAQAHGGDITFTTSPEAGTTFIVRLPEQVLPAAEQRA